MRNYSCSEHLCCLLQFIEQTFGIYLANHVYFSCDHLFMLLWFICLGAGLRAKGLRAALSKQPPVPRDPCGTLSYSCSSLTREQVPPPPPACFWGCSVFGAALLNPSCSSHSPSCTGATHWACICKDNAIFCLVHILNKKLYGALG